LISRYFALKKGLFLNIEMPFFSIVLPTYNRAHLITSTIQAVIDQNFTDWELIIIDDGSKDNTGEVVAALTDPRIKYFYQENTERSIARNNGIGKSIGDFICFADSDDIWTKDHLSVLYKGISANNFKPAFYFTSMRWNFPDFKKDVVFESPVGKNLIEYVIENQIGTPTQCFHRSILEKYQYNPALVINEDVELTTRIVNEYPLIQFSDITVDVIVHGENTKFTTRDYVTPQIKVMDMIFNNPVLKDKISAEFKAKIYHRLHNELRKTRVEMLTAKGDYWPMAGAIINYFVHYPTDPKNKERSVLLLYNFPILGPAAKKLFRTAKSTLQKTKG